MPAKALHLGAFSRCFDISRHRPNSRLRGLSRRRSRVRVPSLPFQDVPANVRRGDECRSLGVPGPILGSNGLRESRTDDLRAAGSAKRSRRSLPRRNPLVLGRPIVLINRVRWVGTRRARSRRSICMPSNDEHIHPGLARSLGGFGNLGRSDVPLETRRVCHALPSIRSSRSVSAA